MAEDTYEARLEFGTAWETTYVHVQTHDRVILDVIVDAVKRAVAGAWDEGKVPGTRPALIDGHD